MSGDTTIQALERLTRMPNSSNPAELIAAQRYYDVYFTGGEISGVDITFNEPAIEALAQLTPAANKLPYFTGAATAALTDFSAFGRQLVDDADASAARTTLGLGTMATQNSSNVSITGGTISGAVVGREIVTDSDNRTFGLSDADKYIRYDGAGGHTWTIPTNASVAYSTGTEIDGFNATAFNLTLTADTGVTVNGVTAGSVTIPPYCGFNIKKYATNGWDYSGPSSSAWA